MRQKNHKSDVNISKQIKSFDELQTSKHQVMRYCNAYTDKPKDYTLKESTLFKKLYDHQLRLGETVKHARLIARAEELTLKKLARARRVRVKYKQGQEIIGKIFKFTHQHIALKIRRNEKPVWLDRRYIGIIKMG
ncbi:hypothetical protein [Cysteiniphilum litorale]|uniref:hypothetical protein n=1 Tax=Cysteiniphilum litorale TaxID=2056700 RepID=UPI003F8850CB